MIGASVVIGVGTGVVMKHTGKKLAMKLSKEWAMSVLCRMGYAERKVNSNARFCWIIFEIKCNFLADVCAVVEMELFLQV